MVILRVGYRYIKDKVVSKNKKTEIFCLENPNGMIFVGGLITQIKNTHKYDEIQINDIKLSWSKKDIEKFEGVARRKLEEKGALTRNN